ncbi:hypothetical protein B0T16DRAFT_173772 [Cercophora newfieldiana]|uniref:Uncharacterized protein n=1 Tax=Cercophora newfieldiana TaxID=92897 RepID=A0AA39XYY7_9PEZI|nr:hypothetical protein B0T16DRAFT_173772 [Cercophora newfieldiana]
MTMATRASNLQFAPPSLNRTNPTNQTRTSAKLTTPTPPRTRTTTPGMVIIHRPLLPTKPTTMLPRMRQLTTGPMTETRTWLIPRRMVCSVVWLGFIACFTPLSHVASLFNMPQTILPFPQNSASFVLSFVSVCSLYLVLDYILAHLWPRKGKPGLDKLWLFVERSWASSVENAAPEEAGQQQDMPCPHAQGGMANMATWMRQHPLWLYVCSWFTGRPPQGGMGEDPPA